MLQIMDAYAALREARVVEQLAVQGRVGFDTVHRQFRHRHAHFCHRLRAVFAMHADFADEAVVVRRDAVALINVAVHADAKTTR